MEMENCALMPQSKYLPYLIFLGIVCQFSRGLAGQKFPLRNPHVQQPITAAGLDRMTLALVERLPTDAEKEFVRSHASRGAFELANQLVGSKEFFDRQSLFWQSQLKQTPAWLWENPEEDRKFLSAPSVAESQRRIIWFMRTQGNSSSTTCNGVWTVFENDQKPLACECDDTVDALPAWDSSASMRVCPLVKTEEYCGQSLQKCVPADARLDPKNRDLGVDRDSAGGRAISRLLNDISLTQGRALALAVVTRQKWSLITTTPARTVQSRSSIDLIRKWSSLSEDKFINGLHSALRIDEFTEPLKGLLSGNHNLTRRRKGPRPMADALAEELVLSKELDPMTMLKPLRASRLNEKIWQWNTSLLLACQIPHLAPQVFSLPLPHPEHAKEGSYFCSSCHLELDKHLKSVQKKDAANNIIQPRNSPIADQSAVRNCAVDHALHFLLGYRPPGSKLASLKKLGASSYQQNSESIAAVIRDLALELVRRSEQ
jgi:hypothetical protein